MSCAAEQPSASQAGVSTQFYSGAALAYLKHNASICNRATRSQNQDRTGFTSVEGPCMWLLINVSGYKAMSPRDGNRRNPRKLIHTHMRFIYMIINNSLSTSQITHCVSITNTSHLIRCKEIIAVYCEKYGKGKTIPVTGSEGPLGCETSRLPYFLDNRPHRWR
jgi:hypothetical protein